MVQLQDSDFDFRSQIAEISSTKRSFAHIDSSATHQFFYSRKSFLTYSRISQEAMAASGVSRLVGEGEVSIPLDGGMVIKAYHASYFSTNILAVGLQSSNFILAFTDHIRPYNACFLVEKGPWKILWETGKKNGLYTLHMDNLESSMAVTTVSMHVNKNPALEGH